MMTCLWHWAAPSEDEHPVVAKAPVQQKTKEAAPKKAPAAKKAAAPRKKVTGTRTRDQLIEFLVSKPWNESNEIMKREWEIVNCT